MTLLGGRTVFSLKINLIKKYKEAKLALGHKNVKNNRKSIWKKPGNLLKLTFD